MQVQLSNRGSLLTCVMIGITQLALAAAPAAGDSWIRQSPYPANDNLTGVYFINDDVGWIAGEDNILMQTTDGGATWSQSASLVRESSGIGYDLHAVQFVDAAHGFAIGDRGWRTTDSGQTWQETAPLLTGTVYGFEFLTAQQGFAWSRRAIMSTSDAGQSWSFVVPEDFSHFIMDVDFHSADLALLVGQLDGQWGVFRSTDGGSNWQRISFQNLDFVQYMSATEVIGAIGTMFYRSTDGGATWTLTFNDFDQLSQADVESLRRIDDNSAAAIGFDARIWITHDRGQTWARVKQPTGLWGVGWDIQFPSANVGYAAGRAGLIYKTTDGGQRWRQINKGAARAMADIVMRPDGLGLAVGEDGMVLRTTDFGQRWTANQLKPADRFFHISELWTIEFADEDTVYVGGQTAIYRSDDAGLTWAHVSALGGNADCLDLYFLSENEGFACGILNAPRGFIDYTNDGGQTWQRRFDSDPYPRQLHMFDANHGRSLIHSQTNLFTETGFLTDFWFTLPGGLPWYHMAYADDQVGWYLGPTGNVLKTSDSGFNVAAQTLPGFFNNGGAGSDWATDLRVLSSTTAYVSTYQFGNPSIGTIYTTSDGDTWSTLEPIAEPARMVASAIGPIDVLPTGEVWAAGGDGYIFASGIPSTGPIGDLDGNGVVDVFDMFALLEAWGSCSGCPEDLDGNGVVDVFDLFELLANWG